MMVSVLLDQIIHTDYGQLTLEWGDLDDAWGALHDDVYFAGQVNGLVGAAQPRNVLIGLARRSGGSAVRIELHDTAPPVEVGDLDIVEVSIEAPIGRPVWWRSWASETEGILDIPPGHHRLRVTASGRDRGSNSEGADEIVDSYLVQIWPSPARDDAIVRLVSENAAHWHREWGSRRDIK